jgi:hypothetical protein
MHASQIVDEEHDKFHLLLGVSDEIAEYRQENGSYAVFQHEPPSIW